MTSYKKRKSPMKNLAKMFLSAILIAGGVFVFYQRKQSNSSVASAPPNAKTTSTAPSAQENFTGGNDKKVTTANGNEGVVKDNNGAVGAVPNMNEWTTSADGAITVYTPTKSALVTEGFTFSGASTHQRVQFRLIDNASGMIAQGSVNVSSGKYSGTLSFSTKGTLGRLDIFYANEDGVESSSVSVPVRYK